MTKAVRFHDYGTAEVLCYEDVPTPEPGPREILVRVHAAWVNPAPTGRYARTCGTHLRSLSRSPSAGDTRLWTMCRRPPCGRGAEALEYVSQNIPGRPARSVT